MKLTYETERLSIRVLSSRSARPVLHFLKEHRDAFDAFEAEKPDSYYTLSYQKGILSKEYSAFRKKTFIRFFLFLKEEPNTIIGTVSFQSITGYPFYSAIIGYKLAPFYQHKGYATEALSMLIPHVCSSLCLHRLEAYIMPENLSSIHLIEKLGFHYEGTALRLVRIKGNWEDHLKYAKVFSTN